ncbi:glycoside hydrolase family 2 protein [Alkalibacterium sp. f15]|uniref:glycoside hydrolase family 2 protein n=1 Tax=Alkalibacterium sp. f15 TaxID=3414029 RepID=UPI003BF810EC
MKRTEYPRPQLVRDEWLNLNGEWSFAFDDKDLGIKEGWYETEDLLDQTIEVPYVYQSKASGINSQENHEIVWYKKNITMPKSYDDKEIILHFGAVDYVSEVFVNGHKVGSHTGGHTPFSFNITPFVVDEKATITLRVFDPRREETIPRGKQTWEDQPHSIWYTNSTGIWQTVWLESVDKTHIETLRFNPEVDKGQINCKAVFSQDLSGAAIDYVITYKGEQIIKAAFDVSDSTHSVTFDLHQKNIFRTSHHHNGWHWTPETPNLFDVKITLRSQQAVLDEVKAYFGMRKIHTEKGQLFLNNKPYYQKLVLDQGYWSESLMTAPDDAALKYDIEISKEMGFNGCRKHQKVEDPRFLYWADHLGYLVWGESASAHFFDEASVPLVTNEWLEIIKRDYNHPSIVAWVPFNESWGINDVGRDEQQQHYSQALYHLIHALDTTRPVISNDGWEMTVTDIGAIHHYGHGEMDEKEKYMRFKKDLKTQEAILTSDSADRSIYANGFTHQGEPILLTEFGGIGYKKDDQDGWGYSSVDNDEAFVSEYARIMEAVCESEILAGYCYTQLYDVEQEINGLLTYGREPKVAVEEIKAINDNDGS